MRYRPSNLLAVSLGSLLLGIALLCENVTLAIGNYATLLLASRSCAVLGALCLASPALRVVRRHHERVAPFSRHRTGSGAPRWHP